MMNRSLLIGLIAGAGAATTVGAVANYARDRALAESAVHLAQGPQSRGVVVREVDGRRVVTAATATRPARTLGPAARDAATFDAATVDAAARDAATLHPAAHDAALPAAAAAQRGSNAVERSPAAPPVRARFAQVVDVQPVTRTVQESREVCTDVPVTRQAPVKDEHRVVGTLAGAVIGGLLGSQVGGGDGRKIATIAGAAAGGYAGNRVQDRVQRSNTVATTERQCETIAVPREETIAYDVTYSYEGETHTARMDREPGRRLPARDGRVLLTANAG